MLGEEAHVRKMTVVLFYAYAWCKIFRFITKISIDMYSYMLFAFFCHTLGNCYLGFNEKIVVSHPLGGNCSERRPSPHTSHADIAALKLIIAALKLMIAALKLIKSWSVTVLVHAVLDRPLHTPTLLLLWIPSMVPRSLT